MLHAFILMPNIYYTLHCVILTQLLNKVLIGVSKSTEFLSYIKKYAQGYVTRSGFKAGTEKLFEFICTLSSLESF